MALMLRSDDVMAIALAELRPAIRYADRERASLDRTVSTQPRAHDELQADHTPETACPALRRSFCASGVPE